MEVQERMCKICVSMWISLSWKLQLIVWEGSICTWESSLFPNFSSLDLFLQSPPSVEEMEAPEVQGLAHDLSVGLGQSLCSGPMNGALWRVKANMLQQHPFQAGARSVEKLQSRAALGRQCELCSHPPLQSPSLTLHHTGLLSLGFPLALPEEGILS